MVGTFNERCEYSIHAWKSERKRPQIILGSGRIYTMEKDLEHL